MTSNGIFADYQLIDKLLNHTCCCCEKIYQTTKPLSKELEQINFCCVCETKRMNLLELSDQVGHQLLFNRDSGNWAMVEELRQLLNEVYDLISDFPGEN